MGLPFKELLNERRNRYELSKAIMSRTVQLLNNASLIPKENKGTIISVAIKQILNNEIKFLNEKKEKSE